MAKWLLAAVLAALLLVPLGCSVDEVLGPSGGMTTSEVATVTAPPQPGLPGPVARTRTAILEAAEASEYDRLRPVLDPDVFLSDYGFGTDPTRRWQALGQRPLEMMNVVLQMDFVVRETNEGTLYQWPSYGPDSSADDLSVRDRELFSTIMASDQLENLVLPEIGYTAPRLGILADGTWWFFIMESGP